VPERTFGSNHLRFLLDDVVLRATTDAPLPMLRDELPFLLDREMHIVLGPDETLAESPARLARDTLDATLDYWREWVRYLSIPVEWQDAVIRAAITLKLCQYEGTGAIVAAMTTSIPEAPYTARNWDYRYCWIRDAAFVVRALNRLGATQTMEGYLRFMDHIVARGDEREIDEEGCLSLAGVLAPVERSLWVKLEGRDVDGEQLSMELEGLAARVAQHEIDHLDGILILDRTTKESRREALARLRPQPVLDR